jgi:hypothetical protein
MPAARLRLALLLVLTLPGCGLVTGPGQDDRLAEAQARWAALGQRDYQYEVRSDCFCGMAGRWIEVTVIGDQVVSGRYLDNDAEVEPSLLPALPTVHDLFERIRDAVRAEPVLLQVEYHPQDGHPTRINVDISYSISDEEYLLQSRNLMGLLTSSGTAPPR